MNEIKKNCPAVNSFMFMFWSSVTALWSIDVSESTVSQRSIEALLTAA